VRPDQRFKNFNSAIGKFYVDMSPIHGAGLPRDQILERQTIYQLDRGVVGQLQLFRKLSDGNHFPVGKAPDWQQGLMLLRGQPHGSGSHFTKAQELTQIEAKSGQFLVLLLRDSARSDLFPGDYRMSVYFHKFWVRGPANLLVGCLLVLATSLFPLFGGDQFSLMKSQDEIARCSSDKGIVVLLSFCSTFT